MNPGWFIFTILIVGGLAIGRKLKEIQCLLSRVHNQGVMIMATLAEYQAQLTRIRTGLDNVVEDIRRIKEGLSNPGLTDAEEAQLLTELGEVADRVDAIDAENPPPTP